MSFVYDGKHGIDFVNLDSTDHICKNSWKDFHLIPSARPFIVPAPPFSQMISLPGVNKPTYVTGFLSEGRTYQIRSGEWEFIIDHDYWKDWASCYRALVDYFHGFKMAVRLSDHYEKGEPERWYAGRIRIKQYDPGDDYSTITLHYDFASDAADPEDLDLQFIISFENYDGTLIYTVPYTWGSTPDYESETYDWAPTPSPVTSSITYHAIDYTDGGLIERTYVDYENGQVTYIPSYAFYNYYTLRTASFPNCSSIGDYAFYGCYTLSLYLMSTAVVELTSPNIQIGALYVPYSLVDSYKNAENWSTISSHIYAYDPITGEGS